METKNFNLIVKLKVTLHCTLGKIVIFMTSVVATLGTNSDYEHPMRAFLKTPNMWDNVNQLPISLGFGRRWPPSLYWLPFIITIECNPHVLKPLVFLEYSLSLGLSFILNIPIWPSNKVTITDFTIHTWPTIWNWSISRQVASDFVIQDFLSHGITSIP